MDPEITITLEAKEPTPRFRLRDADGGVPRVTSITVLDLTSDKPVWWVLPASFNVVLPFEVSEPSEHAIERLASQADIDPLEDLPPSDPRHQLALRERAELQERTLIPLSVISYGVVPPGFRQALPREGPAPVLRHDGGYAIHAMGASVAGYLAFQKG